MLLGPVRARRGAPAQQISQTNRHQRLLVPAAIEQATDQVLANESANEPEPFGCETCDSGDI
jgi:hypothetical protein